MSNLIYIAHKKTIKGTLMFCLFYLFIYVMGEKLFVNSFNQLDLPAYETYDKLRNMMLLALHECSEGFGLA